MDCEVVTVVEVGAVNCSQRSAELLAGTLLPVEENAPKTVGDAVWEVVVITSFAPKSVGAGASVAPTKSPFIT